MRILLIAAGFALTFCSAPGCPMQSGWPWNHTLEGTEPNAVLIARVTDADFGLVYDKFGREQHFQKTTLEVVELIAGKVPEPLVVYAHHGISDLGDRYGFRTLTVGDFVIPGELVLVGVSVGTVYDEVGDPEPMWRIGFVRYLFAEEYDENSDLYDPRWMLDRDRLASFGHPVPYRELITAVIPVDSWKMNANLTAVYHDCRERMRARRSRLQPWEEGE